MSADLVFAGTDGEPFTTSLVIAAETGNEHRAVLQLIRAYEADFAEFGPSAFEMRKGRALPQGGFAKATEYALLTEDQATLLMTYLRNSEVVRAFKKRLVHAFREMRRRLAEVRPLTGLEYARKLVDAEERAEAERARADKAEQRVEIEQRHRQAIEGGDGIDPTTFGKKYFSDVPARKFDEHLYKYGYLINQRNTRVGADGTVRDGFDHRKPTAKGRRYFYPHDGGTHGGRRRFTARVRPQMEIALRDALAAEGLPVNEHSTGLVLLTSDELKELGS
ncbi:Rha family transcriptional regulator [Mycolicibacter arupensis]|uniref:Rha family transcriptional regulator n=1 Tax=Mycolicibacter arupensis TaxID=342002 RepID=A0A0F5MW87_9MYCO|nr:Rha family transcriptional regulator [Mycolicibacter arupensis]KKB98297.1 hypothetical protein WR43_15260 [Mycolicibacter arupensis]OQZ94389.1 hypothetical protein BST15_16610 [Mycolicibacter arupensis]